MESGARPLMPTAGEIPLVGRERELEIFDDCLASVRGGQGTLALIEGVAGVGKSVLAQTVGARALEAGMRFTVGRCYERGIPVPYGPWADIFRDLVSVGAERTNLPEQFGGETPAFSAHGFAELVSQSLRDAASIRPVVALLDDLHWADQESLDLLEHVTRSLEKIAALIVVAYREEEVGSAHPLGRILPSLQHDRPGDEDRARTPG